MTADSEISDQRLDSILESIQDAEDEDAASLLPENVVDHEVVAEVPDIAPRPVFAVGDRVRHRRFGDGIVTYAYSDEAMVRFDPSGRFDRGRYDGRLIRVAVEYLELLTPEAVA